MREYAYLFEEDTKKNIDISDLREEGVILIMPISSLFNYLNGKVRLNPNRERFLDLLAESLLKEYGDEEYVQAEFVFGISSYGQDKVRRMNVTRSGMLVRRLIDRAVDPSHLLTGLEEDHPGKIKIDPEDEKKSHFRVAG